MSILLILTLSLNFLVLKAYLPTQYVFKLSNHAYLRSSFTNPTKRMRGHRAPAPWKPERVLFVAERVLQEEPAFRFGGTAAFEPERLQPRRRSPLTGRRV